MFPALVVSPSLPLPLQEQNPFFFLLFSLSRSLCSLKQRLIRQERNRGVFFFSPSHLAAPLQVEDAALRRPRGSSIGALLVASNFSTGEMVRSLFTDGKPKDGSDVAVHR